ncbi:MAG: hypothetical protein HZA88_18730 [Verrucomicrobia bacterium]|nr:hypothetical protein [Verrucomicrobiota bacterium]
MKSGRTRALPRPTPVKPTTFHLYPGNHEIAHPAHFNGRLDEVRLYSRALPPKEVRQHHRAMSGKP